MAFTMWRRARSVENSYRKALYSLVDMFQQIAKSSGSNQQLYVNRMSDFQESDEFQEFIYSIVRRMVTPLATNNARTWREAARKANRGRILYNALMEELDSGTQTIIENQIIENVSLIRTLPSDTADKVVRDIYDNALKGKRAKSIESIIIGMTSQHARASARLIARTEVSKTTTALTKARSEQLGLKWYVWRTALDGDRVRKSHRNMEDVLVNWNEPPSPEALVGEKNVGYYHAGNIWNCRCYPEPLIEMDDVTWPHRVYHNGSIKRMNKSEFNDLL